MASIQKRGKKYAVVYYIGEGDAREQVWESGLNYTQAKAFKAKIENEQAQGKSIEYTKITVEEYLKEFIEKYGKKKWVSSTMQGNIGLLQNYVYPYLGDVQLKKVKVKTIDDYYDFLMNECTPAANMGKPKRERVGNSIIFDIHKVLRCAWNQAIKWELVGDNPFLKATLPEHKKHQREILTPNEIDYLMKQTNDPTDYDMYVLHCAINLAFACSLRGGELLGLTWDNVDLENNRLEIRYTLDRVYKEDQTLNKMEITHIFPNLVPYAKTFIALKNLKTEGSERSAYVPEIVKEKLKILFSLQEDMKNTFGEDGYMDTNLVISQANGRPIMTEQLNKKFKVTLANLGLKEVVFHSLRASSTTYKLKLSGGDIKAVQGDNGHADPTMVTKQYSRVLDEDRRHLSEKMNDDFYNKKKSKPESNSADSEITDTLSKLANLNSDVLEKLIQLANNL